MRHTLNGFPGFPSQWVARDLFDRGGPARLRVVSLHDQVINVQVDEWNHLLIIADPGMYRGPSSVGLGAQDFETLRGRLKPGITGNFDGERIEFHDEAESSVSLSSADRVSFSVPTFIAFDRASFNAATAAVESEIAELTHSHLCACLLGDDGGNDPFCHMLRFQFPRLLHSLARGVQPEFEDSCSALVGLGYGSTPTGDDLIHGALIALHFMKRASAADAPVPRMPRWITKKTTLLGAHMLETGILGLTPEPIQAFALALLAGQPLAPSLADVRRMGGDSGLSTAVAFYLMVLECLRQGSGARAKA